MLSRHLQWWKNPHDNLVSWTSSLLSALVYIFHLRAIHSEATLDEIQLLVVDTAIFPKGAFMRDLDLVRAFRSVDQHLRNKKSKWSSGYYYFGEYLSQGALKVEGRCQVASAQNIVNDGLYTIRKEFRGFADWKPGSARWADVVIEMRKVFHYDISTRREMSKRAMSAVLRISRQFGPDFQTPIAANLVAIAAPRYRHVPTQFIYPELPLLTVFDWEQFWEEAASIAACDTMPELQEYSAIMQGIYENYPKPIAAAAAEETRVRIFVPTFMINRS